MQPFCKLFDRIMYEHIKTRYNVFRKTEYDVFGERILFLKRIVLYSFLFPQCVSNFNNAQR